MEVVRQVLADVLVVEHEEPRVVGLRVEAGRRPAVWDPDDPVQSSRSCGQIKKKVELLSSE